MSPPPPRRPVAFVTGNPGKLAEARRLAPFELEAVAAELPELQAPDLATVLAAKADAARRLVDGPLVVEETGLELAALHGFPGPFVKWMLAAVGAEGIARVALALGDPAVAARCCLLYDDGARRLRAEGVTRGRLVLPGRGDGGFGWDPVFEPEGSAATYGEMPPEAKDRLSHRGRAWRALARRLSEAG